METEENQHEIEENDEIPPPYEYVSKPCGLDPPTYGYDQPDDVALVVPDQLQIKWDVEPMPNNIAAIIVSAISMLFCCCIGVPALVLAVTANDSNNPKTAKGRLAKAWAFAIAAIILGIVIPGLLYAYKHGILPDDYDHDNY